MYRYIKSAGYHGYSMSNNAVAAYDNGEMPLSKWTKSAILNELVEQEGIYRNFITGRKQAVSWKLS